MNRAKKLQRGAAILALAFLLGGCGAHAGFNIGKSAGPAAAHATHSTAAQAQTNAGASE